MTPPELQQKIDKFSELLTGFNESSANGKALWQMKNEIHEYFKATIFENAEDKQVASDKFKELADALKEKQDTINQENEKFADEAGLSIKKIEELFVDGYFANNPDKETIAALKVEIDKAFEYFKLPRWPSKERRTVLWDKFSELRERVKKEEDLYYITLREKKAEKIERSKSITESLMECIESCHTDAATNYLNESLDRLVANLVLLGYEKNSIEWLAANKDESNKNLLKPKSESLRAIKKFISDNKDDIGRDDKQRLFEKMDFINADLNKAWDLYRESLQKKQEEWEERKKIMEQKRREWETKQHEFLKLMEEKFEKRASDKVNLERILQNKKEFLARQKIRLDNQNEFLKKIKEDLDDMESKLGTAWSEDFKERMAQKVEQKKNKIAEVVADIEEVNAKIKEVSKDITEIEEKIGLIEKNTEEMKTKIEEVKKSIMKVVAE